MVNLAGAVALRLADVEGSAAGVIRKEIGGGP
jgi:hypothetical protein